MVPDNYFRIWELRFYPNGFGYIGSENAIISENYASRTGNDEPAVNTKMVTDTNLFHENPKFDAVIHSEELGIEAGKQQVWLLFQPLKRAFLKR